MFSISKKKWLYNSFRTFSTKKLHEKWAKIENFLRNSTAWL